MTFQDMLSIIVLGSFVYLGTGSPRRFLWLEKRSTEAFHLINLTIGMGGVLVIDYLPISIQPYAFVFVCLWFIAMIVALAKFPKEYDVLPLYRNILFGTPLPEQKTTTDDDK